MQGAHNVKITLDKFSGLEGKAKRGMKIALDALAQAVLVKAKYLIVEQDAVDTGALLNSVYVDSPMQKGTRDIAIEAARQAAETVGKHSGKPHDEPFEPAPEDTKVSGLQAKTAVAAEYGIYIETGTTRSHERPFLTPAAEEIKAKAGEVAAKIIAAELLK